MNPEQLLELIITPAHKYMGGNYQSDSADLLSLCTAAIESDCGYYNEQISGPAISWWMIEPVTHTDIHMNCDALRDEKFHQNIMQLSGDFRSVAFSHDFLLRSPLYACAMARLKYSMTPKSLPKVTGNRRKDERNFYDYYAKFYHGVDKNGKELGKSTFEKWQVKMEKHKVFEVFYKLRGYA